MTDEEALTPRERLTHASTILAGLLASGEYHRTDDEYGLTMTGMEAAADDALELADNLAKKVGIESE